MAPAAASSQNLAAAAAAAQQAAGRIRGAEQSARGQAGPTKSGDPSGADSGQGLAEGQSRPAPRTANGQPEGEARPAGTSEGARHAAGSPRPSSPDDTADKVRID
jgi:hypothetical protein